MNYTKEQRIELEELGVNLDTQIDDSLVDAVLEKARDPNSALNKHPVWRGWDTKTLAEQQLRQCARQLIGGFITVIQDPGKRPAPMRGFVSLVNPATKKRRYVPTARAVRQERGNLIVQICDELLSKLKSYPLVEFEPVVKLVQQIRAAATQPAPKRRGRPKGGEMRASA